MALALALALSGLALLTSLLLCIKIGKTRSCFYSLRSTSIANCYAGDARRGHKTSNSWAWWSGGAT